MAPDPVEQVGQDAGGSAPDHVLADRVGVGADRQPAPDQPLAARSRRSSVRSGSSITAATSRALGVHSLPGLDQPDERIHGVAGGDRRRRLERADQLHRARRGSPISSSASRSAVVRRSASPSSARPPGNEISPAWRRRSSRRLVKTACSSPSSHVQRHEHARRWCARAPRAAPPRAGSSSTPRSSSRTAPALAMTIASACGAPVSTPRGGLDELDPLLEHDLAVERPVHRALGRDHAQPLDLLLAAVRSAGAARA